MPFIIKKFVNGYKVCKRDNPEKCFSRLPLSLKQAKKQLKAIGLFSHLKGGNKYDILKLMNKIKYLYPVGSINRNEEFNDLDFITLKELSEIYLLITELIPNIEIKKVGKKYIQLHVDNVNIDIWKAENKDELKSMLIMRTIEKGHNIGYRKKAKKQGFILNDKGLFKDDKRIIFKNEKELRGLIGLGIEKINNFINQLNKINLTPEKYLEMVKYIAKHRGYNPELLELSNDGIHKLKYNNVNFGRVGYNDKIIYSWLEHNNKIPLGTTKIKYTNYRKRAYDVMKKTNNKYSPASLSYYLIW